MAARYPCDTVAESSTGSTAAPAKEAHAGMWVLVAAILGSSLGQIDGTAVNVALPLVQRELGATAAGLQWIVEGYSLFLSALILVGGALGDQFGRRRVFALGIAIFALASLACAIAPDISFLIFARCVQGVGAALAMPGSLALISAAFSGQARGRAIGTWSGFSAVTTALGPLLGGWLAQTFSWRAVFLINLPLALVVIVIAIFRVPESRDEDAPREVDVIGAALVTLGLGALVYGLIAMQTAPAGASGALATVAGFVLLVAFIVYERVGTKYPMLHADVFGSRAFAGANLYTLLLYAALGGSLYFVPFNLINVQHYTPFAAGASLLPFIVIMFLASRWSGGLVARIGARTPLIIGALFAACGFLAFAHTGIGGSYWTTFFPAVVLLGIGGAFFVAPLTTTAMDAVDVSESGIASGINNAVARAAGLLAVAGLGLALAATFNAQLNREIAQLHFSPATVAVVARERADYLSGRVVDRAIAPDQRERLAAAISTSYIEGFREAMLVAAGLSFGAALVAAFWNLRVQSTLKNA